MRVAIASVLLCVVTSCGGTNGNTTSCTVSCTDDAGCPSGQTCGDLGLCTTGEACTCVGGDFLGCADPDTARFCDPSGTAVATEACNTFGCAEDAGRCNECAANASSCRGNDTVVETCGPDGLVASTETCAVGCVAPGAAEPARCRHLDPVWLPGICDAPAAMAAYASPPATTTTIDTSIDAMCTGGVIQQKNAAQQIVGPDICVIRAGTITLDGTIKIAQRQTPGTLRAIAFVADDALDAVGDIDVSGDGSTFDGPGGGYVHSGVDSTVLGDGGAGFKQVGGPGGCADACLGGAGGAIRDPLLEPALSGGSRPEQTGGIQPAGNPKGGAAGGALLLVSCRGTVTVSGSIDAGGGGGDGGADVNASATVSLRGGAGGGAGGYVVLEGTQVVVTGALYANGGGGGGGCNTNGCTGFVGHEGKGPSANGAGGQGGGGGTTGDGAGGAGGIGTTPPEGGHGNDFCPGGGGGSTGRFQVYTPQGMTPILAPSAIEPPFEANKIVPTK